MIVQKIEEIAHPKWRRQKMEIIFKLEYLYGVDGRRNMLIWWRNHKHTISYFGISNWSLVLSLTILNMSLEQHFSYMLKIRSGGKFDS